MSPGFLSILVFFQEILRETLIPCFSSAWFLDAKGALVWPFSPKHSARYFLYTKRHRGRLERRENEVTRVGIG